MPLLATVFAFESISTAVKVPPEAIVKVFAIVVIAVKVIFAVEEMVVGRCMSTLLLIVPLPPITDGLRFVFTIPVAPLIVPFTVTLPVVPTVRVNAPLKVNIAPEFTVTPPLVVFAPIFTLLPPVVAIITLSAFAGATPPTQVVPAVQRPPVAVDVLTAASARLAEKSAATTKIAANKNFPSELEKNMRSLPII